MIHTAETIDCTIRARGCFSLFDPATGKITIFKPGCVPEAGIPDRIVDRIAKALNEDGGRGTKVLKEFLNRQARFG